MALEYPINRRYQITVADNGKFPTLGEVSFEEVGAWHLSFVPDESFVGSIAIVGRVSGKDIYNDGYGFGTIPFRRVQVGGVLADNSLVTTPYTNSSGMIAIIPSDGMSVALFVECTAGFAYVYSVPLDGSTNVYT